VKGIPRGKYTKEFREEAVKLITEERLSYPEAGRRLQLAPTTIMNWVKASKAGKLGEIGKNYRPLTEYENFVSLQAESGPSPTGRTYRISL
jgi:transposase-like protein